MPAPPPPPPPEPIDSRIARAHAGRQALALQLRAISPREWGRIGLVVGLLLVGAWLFSLTWTALVPFFLAGAVAYLLLPVVRTFDHVLPRPLAVLLALAVGLGAIALVLVIIVPPLVNQVFQLTNELPSLDQLQAAANALYASLGDLPPGLAGPTRRFFDIGAQTLQLRADAALAAAVDAAIATVLSSLDVANLIIGLLAIPAWLYSLLVAQKQGRAAFDRLVPAWARPDLWAVVSIVDGTARKFLRGQLLIAASAGVFTYLMLWILEGLGLFSLQAKIPLALFVAVFQLIPTLGPIISAAVPLFLVSFYGPTAFFSLLAGLISVQVVNGALVENRVKDRLVAINPVVLLLVLVAVSQLGFIWLLVATPLAAIARDLFRYATGRLSEPPIPAGQIPGRARAASRQATTPLAYRSASPPAGESTR